MIIWPLFIYWHDWLTTHYNHNQWSRTFLIILSQCVISSPATTIVLLVYYNNTNQFILYCLKYIGLDSPSKVNFQEPKVEVRSKLSAPLPLFFLPGHEVWRRYVLASCSGLPSSFPQTQYGLKYKQKCKVWKDFCLLSKHSHQKKSTFISVENSGLRLVYLGH